MPNLINESVRINREAHAALLALKRAKPWRGTFDERLAKFQATVTGLNAAYGLEVKLQFHGAEDRGAVSNGAFDHRSSTIHTVGKLSVVTLLHCFARARGMTRTEAFRWSLSVFKRMFPVSFSRCRLVGCLLIRDNTNHSRQP